MSAFLDLIQLRKCQLAGKGIQFRENDCSFGLVQKLQSFLPQQESYTVSFPDREQISVKNNKIWRDEKYPYRLVVMCPFPVFPRTRNARFCGAWQEAEVSWLHSLAPLQFYCGALATAAILGLPKKDRCLVRGRDVSHQSCFFSPDNMTFEPTWRCISMSLFSPAVCKYGTFYKILWFFLFWKKKRKCFCN